MRTPGSLNGVECTHTFDNVSHSPVYFSIQFVQVVDANGSILKTVKGVPQEQLLSPVLFTLQHDDKII